MTSAAPDDASLRCGGWPALVSCGFASSLPLIHLFNLSLASARLVADLSLDPAQVAWIIGAVTVPMSTLPLVTGAAGDRWGERRVFALGALAFGLALVLGALSSGLVELVLANVVLGTGGAMMLPQTLSAATRSLGPARKGFAIGVWGAVSSACMLAGPLGGDLLLSRGGWQALFWVNLPLVMLALVSFVATVPARQGAHAQRRFPIGNVAICTGSIGALILSLDSACHGHAGGIAGMGLGFGGIAWWSSRERDERRQASAILGRRLWQSRAFMMACLAAGACSAVMLGGIVIVSFAMAGVASRVGGGAPSTGHLYVPAFLAIALAMPAAGALAQRRTRPSARTLALGVLALCVTPIWLDMVLHLDQLEVVWMAVALCVQGAAMGTIVSYVSFSAIAAADPASAGLAAGAISMSRNVGRGFGAAIFASIAGVTGTTRAAFYAAVVLAALAIPFALHYNASVQTKMANRR